VVLIGIAGSRLEISIAVYVGAIFVSDLVTINLSRGFHGSNTTIRLARIFKALASCLQELKSYYEGIRHSSQSDFSFLYPHPVTANQTALPPIKYDKYLGLNGLPIETVPDLGKRSTAVYTGSFNGDEVLIKFTHRYNDKAHTLLAEAGLAPRLHFFNPVVGDLLMIVMDYIPGAKSVLQLRAEESSLPSIIPEQVEKAVTLLHDHNIVFGDLRDGNVIYTPPTPNQTDGRVMLVDFDWAGSHDIDRYSATLNPDGGWADGVSQYGIMRKEHDLWQLNRLKELYRPNNP
jgi:serine/threonine protein kinase